MSKDELIKLIQRFADHPIPSTTGRHVYLWHGNLESLERIVPSWLLVSLDLHQMVTKFTRTPRARDEAARLIRQALRSFLDIYISSEQQYIFLVIGCDLLSRYQVPLGTFFSLASETRMVIFVISPAETNFHPSIQLPEYVSFNPMAPLKFMKDALGDSALIETDEE